jgi:hypothetical protein
VPPRKEVIGTLLSNSTWTYNRLTGCLTSVAGYGFLDNSGLQRRTFYSNSELGFFPRRRDLSLAAFVARLKDAGVPRLILGMDGAEPAPARTAVEGCGRIAGLIEGRNGLTRPAEVLGFRFIHVLQHIPSSCGQYTPDCRRGVPEGSCPNSSLVADSVTAVLGGHLDIRCAQCGRSTWVICKVAQCTSYGKSDSGVFVLAICNHQRHREGISYMSERVNC